MDVNVVWGAARMEDGGGHVQMKTRRKVIVPKRRYTIRRKRSSGGRATESGQREGGGRENIGKINKKAALKRCVYNKHHHFVGSLCVSVVRSELERGKKKRVSILPFFQAARRDRGRRKRRSG